MARYKHYGYKQTKMLPVNYERQILPGTFEHTLSYLIDNKIDLSVFEDRYQNDATGAPAYDPAILLKIILFAYSKGIIHSRKIEALCRENVVCMALSADTVPHFTTIAHFVATLSAEVTRIFRDVLLVCDEAGLIGKEMFAVDGVKLPSNASKEWSGTKADLKKKARKLERGMANLLKKRRECDLSSDDTSMSAARETFNALDLCDDVMREAKLTADAGYSSKANATYLYENGIDAYVADTMYRKRDLRFKDAERHVPRKPDAPFSKPKKEPTRFQNSDFKLSDDHSHCICPAGKRINRNTAHARVGDIDLMKFRGTLTACMPCPLRAQCLRYPNRTPFRQVAFMVGKTPRKPTRYLELMRRKIDTDQGRYQYSRRLGTVEPVFANIRHTHRLNRFSLRTRKKVNAQWLLFCLVHKIGKVQRHGAHVMTMRSRKRRKVA